MTEEPAPSVTVTFEPEGGIRVRHSQVFVPPSLSVAPEAVVRETIKHLNEWLARHEGDQPEWRHGELR